MLYFVFKKNKKTKKTPYHPKKLIVEEGDLEDRKRKYRKKRTRGARKWKVGPLKMCPSVKCAKILKYSVIGFLVKTSNGAEL